MTDIDSCTCPGLKASVVTAMYGRPQPICPDHPRGDDGEHEAPAIPLNGRTELRAAMLADLNNGTDAACPISIW